MTRQATVRKRGSLVVSALAFSAVGGMVCRESPPVQVKEPYSSLHDYLYALILQNRCVQCTPAHNPRGV